MKGITRQILNERITLLMKPHESHEKFIATKAYIMGYVSALFGEEVITENEFLEHQQRLDDIDYNGPRETNLNK
jgi:hypothetical protein